MLNIIFIISIINQVPCWPVGTHAGIYGFELIRFA